MHCTLFAAVALVSRLASSAPLTTDVEETAVALWNPPPPKCYYGTEFPAESQWILYGRILSINLEAVESVSTIQETVNIYSALNEVANESGMDGRLIFAVMMQESIGNARVIGGLMQVNRGTTCQNERGDCPRSKVKAMIAEGVYGNGWGNGLKPCYEKYGRQWGPALRCYNSGKVNQGDLTDAPFGTRSYVSDIANRLMGASPARACGF